MSLSIEENMDLILSQQKRRKTREVKVGSLYMGAHHPIRIQSMTTTPTADVEATVTQIMQLADAGCEVVRVTVQGIKEALACEKIKSLLIQKGYTLPVVADIHFFPKAALQVVEFVDKVRINPGNFADKRASFKQIEYTDQEYHQELLRLEETLLPLIEKCKRNQVALRIGSNQGSLSDRIMNRFGDTVNGMVISALEYAEICVKHDFHQLVFSMKSSNTNLMIEAYRQLVYELDQKGWNYPLHLGVTEAGSGPDGRMKSAVGIGTLLLQGLGDTLRVSLTEDPIHEIDPCRGLVQLAQLNDNSKFPQKKTLVRPAQPFQAGIKLDETDLLKSDLHAQLGLVSKEGSFYKGAESVDFIWIKGAIRSDAAKSVVTSLKQAGLHIYSDEPLKGSDPISWFDKNADLSKERALFTTLNAEGVCGIEKVKAFRESPNTSPLFLVYQPQESIDPYLSIGAECGLLIHDGWIDGVLMDSDASIIERRNQVLMCLQATRKRAFKTEFISCPSCGRTLFDLQKVTKDIQSKTAHLPGVKIAVMGCIVNGPGEMADADFGYVGSKPGKVDLYVGKERVERDIDSKDALQALVNLLKAHGVWVDPKEASCSSSPALPQQI